MAIRTIELLGSPVLRERAREVTEFDDSLRALVADLFETMYHAEGIGLAAPQVGVSLRVFVVDLRTEEGGEETFALVNPVLVEAGAETERSPEGCLSIPGLEEVVERPSTVVVEGSDPHGNPVRIEAEGLRARVLLHELDHLDGILFIDRVSPLKRKMLLKKWRRSRAEAAAG